MPRKQYPSDHRRYFRVMEDILDDDGYRGLSPSEKVAWIDLLAIFNRRKAHQTGNSIVLAWSSAMSALGAQNRRAACARAARLARGVRVCFARTPTGLLCLIPNWSELQGLTPTPLRRDSDETPSPTPTPTPTPTPKKNTVAPPGAPRVVPPVEAFDRVKTLAEAIQASVPGQAIPTTEKKREDWAVILDRLHRLGDGQPWETIDAVIAWLPTHERPGFRWGLVVLSARKLRAHFPRLLVEMQAKPTAPPKSFAQIEEDKQLEWLKRRSDAGPDAVSLDGAGRPLLERGD